MFVLFSNNQSYKKWTIKITDTIIDTKNNPNRHGIKILKW